MDISLSVGSFDCVHLFLFHLYILEDLPHRVDRFIIETVPCRWQFREKVIDDEKRQRFTYFWNIGSALRVADR